MQFGSCKIFCRIKERNFLSHQGKNKQPQRLDPVPHDSVRLTSSLVQIRLSPGMAGSISALFFDWPQSRIFIFAHIKEVPGYDLT